MRCREQAGLLFKHRCQEPASGQCSMCHKPICQLHQRPQAYNVLCIGCTRNQFRANPYAKTSMGHLRDDPYFYWYFHSSSFHDPYGDDDYSLFDTDKGDIPDGPDDAWAGS